MERYTPDLDYSNKIQSRIGQVDTNQESTENPISHERRFRRFKNLLLLAMILPSLAWPGAASAENETSENSTPLREHTTLIIPCNFADSPSPDPQYNTAFFEGMAAILDNYIREISNNQAQFQGEVVDGWSQTTEPTSAYNKDGTFNRDRIAEACVLAANADPDLYDSIAFLLNLPSNNTFIGDGDYWHRANGENKPAAWLTKRGWTNLSTFAHEELHALLRADHSYGVNMAPYENFYDVMSYVGCNESHPQFGCLPQHPIAYTLMKTGLLPQERAHHLQEGIHTIELDTVPTELDDTKALAIAWNINGGVQVAYTIEVREPEGFDKNLPIDQGVFVIHRITWPRPVVELVANDTGKTALLPGGRFYDPTGQVDICTQKKTEANRYIVTVAIGAQNTCGQYTTLLPAVFK